LQIINDSNYLAQQYFGLGKLEKSKSYYFDILKIEPKTEFALVGLAYVYTEAGEKGTAIEIIKSAIDNNPTNYNLWIQYLDLQKSAEMNNGDLDKIFNTALEKTGRHINLVVKYAVFMESIGNIPKAISLWEEAIKQNPEMVELYKEEILRLKQINNSK
jgi:tetratricopeptide (TPR) repeat protein